MESFAPEFAQFWLEGPNPHAGEPPASRDDESTAQRAALEALAERVTLARSIS